ncbi:MAG: UbiA family prenyltransferase [Methanomicrobiales archaeon]|nr:UbiA family prenyltransferase [Methanomicrobiales archaeon]
MHTTLRPWLDLTRAHFAFVWPLLFCAGAVLAWQSYGGFSWASALVIAGIGFFGFETGMVLNDYVDRERDTRDINDALTRYWRPFHTRPLAEGHIAPRQARYLILGFFLLTVALILTLPAKNALAVGGIMLFSYAMEVFYQLKKRSQRFPVAQLLGRTDFALFPAAGYLAAGAPDLTALLIFLFFYPFAEAHLAVNDLADVVNDRAREMATVTVLYGERGTAHWILACTALHVIFASIFLVEAGTITRAGFVAGFVLLAIASLRILRSPDPGTALSVLPLVHVTMLVQIVSILLDAAAA